MALGLGVGLPRAWVGTSVSPATPETDTFSFRSNKGVNTSTPSYFDPSKPYLNMAKCGGHGAKTTGSTTYRAGRFVPIGAAYEFDAAIEYGVNSDGYPTSMSTAVRLDYYIATAEALNPSGDYIAKWDGSPTVSMTAGASVGVTVTSSTSNRIEFTWGGTQLVLTVTATGATPMSNLVVCRAEDEAAIDAGELFRDEYLAMLSGIAPSRGLAAIRTMDLTNTNLTADSTTLRPVSFISWSEAPPAVCAELAVALGADLWWCCPHLADATYMADAADAIFAVLDGTGSNVLLEFSNEHWNSGFASYTYGITAGAALGSTDAEKTFRWQAQQSLALWAAFEAAGFTPGTNQWNVFGAQAANGNAFTIGCPYNDPTHGRVQDHWHFGTVACYVALNVDSPTKTSYVLGVSPVEDLFNTYSGGAIPHLGAALATLETDLASRISEIDTYGGHCIFYEGGQHAVGVGSEVNDTSLTALLVSLQQLPEMATLYEDLIAMIAASGAWFCCWYTACDTWEKFGSFGLCEDPMDTPLATNYTKYGAVAGYSDAQWWDETPPPPSTDRILDTLSIEFDTAGGLVLLTGDYADQPLVRLVRLSDSAEEDFSHASGSNWLDADAVDTWRSGADVDVVKVYAQIGVNHVTFASGHRPPLVVSNVWATWGSASRPCLQGTGYAGGPNVTTTAPYGTFVSSTALGADSSYVYGCARTDATTTRHLFAFQGSFSGGAGFAGQWWDGSVPGDATTWRQDLSSASPSMVDTADRYGSSDGAVGKRLVVGRRNAAGDSDLIVNGTNLGTHTSIGAAGPGAGRYMAGIFHATHGSHFFYAIAANERMSDDDADLLAEWFDTEFPT